MIKTKERFSLNELLLMLFIWIQFLLSISTSFIDNGIYNTGTVIITVLVLTVYIASNRRLSISKSNLCLYTILLIIFTYNFLISNVNTKKILVWLTCFLIGLIYERCSGEKAKIALLKGYWGILLATCIFGVIESITGNKLDAYTVRVYSATYRLHSVFLHPIIFAQMMVIEFILNFYIINKRVLKYIVGFMCIFCIVMSLSRFAWITIIMVIAFMLIKNKTLSLAKILGSKTSWRRFVEVVLVLIGLIIILIRIDITSILASVIRRWNALEGSMSVSYRFSTLLVLVQQRLQDSNPVHWLIGSGYQKAQVAVGNAGIYFGTVGNSVIDNQWLCFFYDFGLVGIVTLIVLFVKSITTYFKTDSSILGVVSLVVFANLMMAFVCETFVWSTTGNITFVFIGLFWTQKEKKMSNISNQ